MKFKEKLIRFMYGRNGMDKMTLILLWTGVILSVVNVFIRSIILTLLNYFLIGYCIFRMMSKNVWKRRNENERFMRFFNRIGGFFKLQKNKLRDRKTHVYRQCPSCHANLRLPKAKGVHTVKCPRCSFRFEVKGR
ncbi:MAG: hypothetical protein E7591_04085 [Ruminococcaceae bacterium]|nr:hypothetical protein [Oscillospiraceae bacterium]